MQVRIFLDISLVRSLVVDFPRPCSHRHPIQNCGTRILSLCEMAKRRKNGPSCEATPSFHQRLGAKRNIHARERAAPPRRNVDFVARTSILDQNRLVLVPKTDRTGALSNFAFGSPLTLLVWKGGGLWHRKSNAGERG
jgi:hypothetical protein